MLQAEPQEGLLVAIAGVRSARRTGEEGGIWRERAVDPVRGGPQFCRFERAPTCAAYSRTALFLRRGFSTPGSSNVSVAVPPMKQERGIVSGQGRTNHWKELFARNGRSPELAGRELRKCRRRALVRPLGGTAFVQRIWKASATLLSYQYDPDQSGNRFRLRGPLSSSSNP